MHLKKQKNVVKKAVDINWDGELTFEDFKEAATKIEAVSKKATKKTQDKILDMKL